MTRLRFRAEEIFCAFCGIMHPRTKEFYYFNSEGHVNRCKAHQKALSSNWAKKNYALHQKYTKNYGQKFRNRKKLSRLRMTYKRLFPDK